MNQTVITSKARNVCDKKVLNNCKSQNNKEGENSDAKFAQITILQIIMSVKQIKIAGYANLTLSHTGAGSI